jgi:DNA-binding NarL/FixJ family response regulator
MRLKVLVVDDHQLIREGLRPVVSRLSDGDAVPVEIHEASSYEDAVALADMHPDLDLLLLDLRLPNVSGFAALCDIQERHPGLPVVVMSGDSDADLVREALEHGALGFIPKSSASAVILQALRLVLSGGTYIPREIMAGRSQSPAPAPEAAHSASAESNVVAGTLGITPRQSDVLALLLAGKSNKVICRELSLAEGTVKIHVAAVLKALNVSSRVQAVIVAAKLGIRA